MLEETSKSKFTSEHVLRALASEHEYSSCGVAEKGEWTGGNIEILG